MTKAQEFMQVVNRDGFAEAMRIFQPSPAAWKAKDPKEPTAAVLQFTDGSEFGFYYPQAHWTRS